MLKLVMLIAAVALVASCTTVDDKDIISWNLEISDAGIPMTDKCDPGKKLQSIQSPEKPQYIPGDESREARVRIKGLPCPKKDEAPVYEIPVSRISRVTYVSDPLSPPTSMNAEDLAELEGCCRNRNGWFVFDKLEFKGMIGYRGDQDDVTYPGNPPVKYESSFFGFERGGSSMIVGLDAIFSWDALFIDKERRFQLGLITGIWPHDESIFVPIGLNARYTFNNQPGKYSDYCNSWYLYGNIGLPLDFETNAPLIGNNIDFQRYFWGFGIGHDWAINCDWDFSLDLGVRGMNLPLPEITCCPDIPEDQRNPFRNSTALVLRFGLTF